MGRGLEGVGGTRFGVGRGTADRRWFPELWDLALLSDHPGGARARLF